MGLILLARAGYDPSEAPEFWERFARSHAGSQTPEFLSTHPADDRRAAELRALLPKAIELYAKSEPRYGKGETIAIVAGPVPASAATASPTATTAALWDDHGHQSDHSFGLNNAAAHQQQRADHKQR